jgi:two-component system response regulator AtoC
MSWSERGKRSVLVVSPTPRADLDTALSARGLIVTRVASALEAASRLEVTLFDVVLAELGATPVAPGMSLSELRGLAERWPDLPLVACAALAGDELIEQAVAAGAIEYLSLPASPAALDVALAPALERRESVGLESPHVSRDVGLLGSSPQMAAVRDRVARVASGIATVLVRGETGTGKELVARALHAESARAAGPFIRVHAAALPDALLESELFGYEKGAFTGAHARKPGRVELAEGGTLFFDEIGELTAVMQVKLLRLLQEREFERLGGTRTLRADVRFVAATHRDLENLVQQGRFREDLFYRLNVVAIWVPPLRARREDALQIANHYLRVYREASGKPRLRFHDSALGFLVGQRWPGNVRQLVNFIERLVVLAQRDTITLEDVQRHLNEQMDFLTQAAEHVGAPVLPTSRMVEPEPRLASNSTTPAALLAAPTRHFSSAVRPLREDVRRAEERALLKALQYAGGNRALAARMLGVSRRTLYTKLEEHGIE